MPQLNIKISDEAMKAARDKSEQEGMLMRRWVERLILEAPVNLRLREPAVPERKYAPIEEL